jgi:uncharacterized lipoprotein YddW (UPF0748 family)
MSGIKYQVYIIIFLLIHLICLSEIYSQSALTKRDLRGAWIATVANIDWPSDRNLPVEDQKKELINILDRLKESGINAVFFQVRTECDALYNSSIEPWSYWLTGQQGKKPDPYYDPLDFIITEAHNRCMELHAWFNPYRAVGKVDRFELASNHVSIKHPDWILQFGEMKMLNPGIPEVRNYILSVIEDVIKRYNLDGVHFDDYFYPYTPIKNEDSTTYELYKGNFSDINEWRRNNINSLITDTYKLISITNPKIKFGVSPFGIVENKYTGTSGFESYNVLYSDPIFWLNNKTIDYICPQLYWKIGHRSNDYRKLLPWWINIKNGRQLFIGHFSTKFMEESYTGSKLEMGNQLRLDKATGNVDGDVYFSAKSICNNFSGLSDSMRLFWYRYPAIPPAMCWKDSVKPLPPLNLQAEILGDSVRLSWQRPKIAEDGDYPSYYLLYRFAANEEIDLNNSANILTILPANKTEILTARGTEINIGQVYVVTSLDKSWNESTQYAYVRIN